MNLLNKTNESIIDGYLPKRLRNALKVIALVIGIPLAGFNGVHLLVGDSSSIGFAELFMFILFLSVTVVGVKTFFDSKTYDRNWPDVYILSLVLVFFFSYQGIRIISQNNSTITTLEFLSAIALLLLTYSLLTMLVRIFMKVDSFGKSFVFAILILSIVSVNLLS